MEQEQTIQSLSALLASEERLISEAAEALPHQFNTCTYSQGHIRQAVYLCLTCSVPRGICSACSIACHTDHEQVELFPKRQFRCDCPTSAIEHPCTLHKTCEADNSGNTYGQNFKGVFCRCGRPYDAKQERETMIQCLACEDWFHESCLHLRERPPPFEPSPEHVSTSTSAAADKTRGPEEDAEADEQGSEVSSSGLLPPRLTEDDYESLVCGSCVLSNSTLRRWAGTPGAMMIVRDDVDGPWTTIEGVSEEGEEEADAHAESGFVLSESESGQALVASASGRKRTLLALEGTTSEDSRAKRPRTGSQRSAADGSPAHGPISNRSSCIAPHQPVKAARVLDSLSSDPPNYGLGAGDVFLADGWRTRWCHCDKCLAPLGLQPYLLEEEVTYEPPEDPESGFSLEELGMRALQSLPRDRVIDGIQAFNDMRDDLVLYLRRFARDEKVVNEADIRAFFDEKREARRAQADAS